MDVSQIVPAMDIDGVSEAERLRNHLKESRGKLSKWSDSATHKLNTSVDQHENTMLAYKEEMSTYLKQTSNLKQDTAQLGQVLEEKLDKLEALKTELEKVRDLRKILSVTHQEEQKTVSQVSQEINDVKQDLQEETSIKRKLQTLDSVCDQYKEHLGLSMKKTKGNRVQFIFTQIDEAEPDEIFYFFCTIGKDRSYIVSDSKPPVEDLDQLVETLNSTNNLSAFIAQMRQKFKAIVTSK